MTPLPLIREGERSLKMPSKTIAAIICITALLGIALWQNVNGAILSTGIALIAGLGGYAIHKAKPTKGNDHKPPEPPVT